MSEHCQNNMDSCREFFDYCMKRSQAEKDGRSLEPDLRYVLPGLGKEKVVSTLETLVAIIQSKPVIG